MDIICGYDMLDIVTSLNNTTTPEIQTDFYCTSHKYDYSSLQFVKYDLNFSLIACESF
jgi:hypothetical protein